MKDFESLIKELLESVRTLEETLEKAKKPIETSSQIIPQTTENIRDVMQFLEDTSHNIMNYLEEINTNSKAIQEDIDFLMSLNPTQKIKDKLVDMKKRNDENLNILLQLFSMMSFHDLAGQQLKLVISSLESIKENLINVIVAKVAEEKKLEDKEVEKLKGKVSELLTQDRVSQDDVDKLLEEYGL